jgi:acyl carrier protein
MNHQDRIVRLIARVMEHSKTITPSKLMVDELGFDSIQLMELIAAVEDEFDLLITLDSVSGIKTVQDLFDAVERELVHTLRSAAPAEALDGAGR